MATRKTSSSGAYMSQYDNEVEARLKVIESELKALRAQCDAHCHAASTGSGEKLDELIRVLKLSPQLNVEKLSKGKL